MTNRLHINDHGLNGSVRSEPRRPISPIWVNDPAFRPGLVSLPPTLHQVRDERLAGLESSLLFWRVMALGLLVACLVLAWIGGAQ